MPVWTRQRRDREPHEPGPSGGMPRCSRSGSPSDRPRPPCAGHVAHLAEPLAGGVRDHKPGRHAAGEQRADHRAGGGPDDVLGAAGVPAGLAGDRVQGAGEPGAAQHAAGAEHETNPRCLTARRASVASVLRVAGADADLRASWTWDMTRRCAAPARGASCAERVAHTPSSSASAVSMPVQSTSMSRRVS